MRQYFFIRKLFHRAAAMLFFTGMHSYLFCQTISYLIPDIGIPGRNTYMEIIGPYDLTGNFGADGIYLNNPGDALRLTCVNNADTNKIKIGPLAVSWNGRMIATQIFIMPGISPDSYDWQQVSSAYRIPLQVQFNGISSNADTFFIVQPQPAISTAATGQLGSGGAWGIRSKRGAMILDSFSLQAGADVSVSASDCDPFTAGNQGYLPATVLSKGSVSLANGALLSLTPSANPHAAPGGGGGSTESHTSGGLTCSPPNKAGNGFTGGGAEMACCTEVPGQGAGTGSYCTGCGGYGLNGVPGGEGAPYCADEDRGGGGTGHPFGTGGFNQQTSSIGGYGGATGWNGYGGGGYASQGTSTIANLEGKAHGNEQVVPLAGGSGGAGGPAASQGGGGGGGGAIALHAFYSSDIIGTGEIAAAGGSGNTAHSSYRGGGGGSGGGVILTGKLPSQGTGNINVAGGAGGFGQTGSQGGLGGAGRTRVDGPFVSVPAINPSPGAGSASFYTGLSTDTAFYVDRLFTLTGTGNGQDIQIYIKPLAGEWQLASTVSGYAVNWLKNLILPCPDTIFFLAAIQQEPTPDAGAFTAEPQGILSQAAANILFVKNALKAEAGKDTVICANTCIYLDGNAAGGFPPYEYLWLPATGLVNTAIADPLACPPATAMYTLTVTDTTGCTIFDSVKVTIASLPSAAFSPGDTCIDSTVSFTDFSTIVSGNISQWDWDFGDGDFETVFNPTHTYQAPGSYPVTLKVTSDSGCTDTVTRLIYVAPVAGFSFGDQCFGIPVSFTDAAEGVAFWEWQFGDPASGGATSALQNPQHFYITSGSFIVRQIVTSWAGCKDTLTDTVTVHPRPVADFKPDTVCLHDSTQFVDLSVISSGNIAEWRWYFGDGPMLSYEQNPYHTYALGFYDVTLEVVSDKNCKDTVVKKVGVFPLPVADFYYRNPCLNEQPASFSDSSHILSETINAWQWDFGDGAASFQQHPFHTYSSESVKTVTLIVTSEPGCIDTVQKQIEIYPAPVALFETEITAGCQPLCINISDKTSISTGTISSWQWNAGTIINAGQDTLQHPAVCYDNAGSYTISLSVITNKGCKDTLEKQDYITVWPLPVADFSASPQPATIQDMEISFSDVSAGNPVQWNWTFYDNDSPASGGIKGISQLQNPLFNFSTAQNNPMLFFLEDSGEYPVTLIVTTQEGCRDTISKKIFFESVFYVNIPNSFTPNGDGMNDYFFPSGIGINPVENFSFYIFNRWGDLIFESHRLDDPWDGVARAVGGTTPVQQDVYVWMLELQETTRKQDKHKYIGHVTVVR